MFPVQVVLDPAFEEIYFFFSTIFNNKNIFVNIKSGKVPYSPPSLSPGKGSIGHFDFDKSWFGVKTLA